MKTPLELAKELVRHLEVEQNKTKQELPKAERNGLSNKAIEVFLNEGPYGESKTFSRADGKTVLNFDRITFEVKGSSCFIRNYWKGEHVYTEKLPYFSGAVVTFHNFLATSEVSMDC